MESYRIGLIGLVRTVRDISLLVTVTTIVACGSQEDDTSPPIGESPPAEDLAAVVSVATLEEDAVPACAPSDPFTTIRYSLEWSALLSNEYPWPEKYCTRISSIRSGCPEELDPSFSWPQEPDCTDGAILNTQPPSSCATDMSRLVRISQAGNIVASSESSIGVVTLEPAFEFCPGTDVVIEVVLSPGAASLTQENLEVSLEAVGEAGVDATNIVRVFARTSEAHCVSLFSSFAGPFWTCAE